MHERSLALTAMAVAAVAVALYSLVAGISLVLAGLLGVVGNPGAGAGAIVLGALFLGLTVAAFLVGAGFWTRKPWAWGGGVVVFGMVIVTDLAAVFVGANIISILVPIVGSAAAIWFLNRREVRAQLLTGSTDGGGTLRSLSEALQRSLRSHRPAGRDQTS